jgi:hypothetical protein
MLRLIYSPPDAEPQTYELSSLDDLQSHEAETAEEAGGIQWRSYAQWAGLLDEGSIRAWRVLLWIMMRRTNPDLDLNELRFPVGALRFDIDEEPEDEPEQPTPPEGEPGKDETSDSATAST